MKLFVKTLAAIAATTIVFAACSNIMDDLKVRPASQPEPTTTPTPAPAPEQTPTPTPAPVDPALSVPLTLEAAEAGAVVTFVNKATGSVTYKVKGGTAQTIASGARGTITLSAIGDKVEFFGDNKAYASDSNNYSNIACDKDCYVYGNIMSLVNSTHFEKATALEEGYTFARFFRDNTHIKNKDDADLLLPAATLANYCYSFMFDGCYSLTKAPALPATTLANSCYSGMFYGCKSLTTAPELPATTLADYCYSSMFRGCASLTAAPELKAATLADSCYYRMFDSCASLTAAPSLPAATLAERCYDEMFFGCTSLTAAPSLPATTLANYCYSFMFRGCTSLTAAPELKAATLANSCYSGMFYGCKSLTTAPELPATTLANSCYSVMFYGCTSLTAAPSLPATTLAEGCYNRMFYGCTSLNSVTCLATNISASDCTTNWLDGVAPTGTFIKAKNMTNWPTNTSSGIPSGWNTVDYEKISIPLTLEAAEAGAVVTFKNKALGPVTYKVNGGESQTILGRTTKAITLAAIGDKVEFFGDNKAYMTNDGSYSNITCSNDCYLYGNIMSLIKSEGFERTTTLEQGFTFRQLFSNNTHIKNKDGAELLLPATTLAWDCYNGMFSGCTGLTVAPALPATALANSCYREMFFGCSGLTSAPALPATTMANSCCCCMFYGCSSLASVTCLATDISTTYCTYNWLDGVADSGTFTRAAGVDWPSGASGIPSGWTVVDK